MSTAILEIAALVAAERVSTKRLAEDADAWEVWTPGYGILSGANDHCGVLACNSQGKWAATVNAYPHDNDPSYRFESARAAWEWYIKT